MRTVPGRGLGLLPDAEPRALDLRAADRGQGAPGGRQGAPCATRGESTSAKVGAAASGRGVSCRSCRGDDWLLGAAGWIERNPVKAGLANAAKGVAVEQRAGARGGPRRRSG